MFGIKELKGKISSLRIEVSGVRKQIRDLRRDLEDKKNKHSVPKPRWAMHREKAMRDMDSTGSASIPNEIIANSTASPEKSLEEKVADKVEEKIDQIAHEERMKKLDETPGTYRCVICGKEGVNKDNFQPYKEKDYDGSYKEVYICSECLTK